MKAIVSVIGKDRKGIIAKVSNHLFDVNINIEDISQTIMQDYFTMIMMVDLNESKLQLQEVRALLEQLGTDLGVEVRIQHQSIFDSMHKI